MLWGVLTATACYLGIFMFGLHFMSRQISGAAGPALNRLLARVAGKPWTAFLAGCLTTAIIQSSSVTTVMVVGLVNARLLNLSQAVAVIIGANVGTTMTAQLLSINLHRVAVPLIIAAVLLCLFLPSKIRPAAAALAGFGLIMFGMGGMVGSLSPLQDYSFMAQMFGAAGDAPWKGLGGGIFASVILQSSSAVMGLVLSLLLDGMIPLPAAMALIIGADLGTCSTALVATVGMGRAARSAAWSHFLFNLISMVLAMIFFSQLLLIASATAASPTRQLANFHTLYNLLGAFVLLPLTPPLTRLLEDKYNSLFNNGKLK